MKKLTQFKRMALALLLCFAGSAVAWGQTYYAMSSGDYSQTFTGWSGYATNWNGLAALATGSVPAATKTTVATTSLGTIGSSTAVGYDASSSTKLVFLATGATDNGAAVACDLNIDFTGKNAGKLNFDYACVLNSAVASGRAESLIVYASADGGSTWSTLGGPYTVYNTTGASTAANSVSVSLPASFNNAAQCKLRFYVYNGGTVVGTPSGSRPKISLDNVSVTSAVAVPVVSAGSPSGTVGTPFNYQIVATNTPTSYAIAAGTLPAGLSLNTSTGVISGTPSAAGSSSVDVTATNAGGTSSTATLSFSITSPSGTAQTITFGALPTKTYGDASFGLTATASSALPVSYSSSNTAVATVSGSTVTIVGAGTTTITASQSGDGTYNPATDVPQTLTVSAKALTVTGAAVTSKTYNGTNAAVITGTLSGVINSDDVTLVGAGTFADANAGTAIAVTSNCSLGGTKAPNYTLTQPTGLTGDITKASQTITFGTLAAKASGDAPFALTATASSALTVSYVSSNTSVATVSGSTVTIVGVGSTTITASQAGDGNYNAATPVDQTLTVNLAAPVATAATGLQGDNALSNAFVANWSAVSGATGYQVNVYTKSGGGSASETEAFDGVTINGNLIASATYLTGWAVSSQSATRQIYTSAGNYGVASPSLALTTTGDYIKTKTYTSPISSFSFWAKAQSPTAPNYSTALIEGYDGQAWITIATLSNSDVNVSTGATKSYDLVALGKSNITQIRITFTKVTNGGNLSIDDVNVVYAAGGTSTPITGSPYTVSGDTQLSVTGLPVGTYYYTVTATNGVVTSAASNEISAAIDLTTALHTSSVGRVIAGSGCITLKDVADVQVFNTQGVKVAAFNGMVQNRVITLKSGVYLIKTGQLIQRVLVK